MTRSVPFPIGRRAHWGLLAGLGLASCGGGDQVTPFEQITNPGQLYMQLVLNHGAVNLSTVASYTTLQLVATPLDALGVPMPGLPAPTFRSTDTTKVRVSATGLLTAVGVGAGVSVIAELVAPGNVRHADTAIVNVNVTTDPPPVMAMLSIHPVPPDSAIVPVRSNLDPIVYSWTGAALERGVPSNLTRRTRAQTATGDSILGLTVEYVSLDPAIATVNRRTGAITTWYTGQARLLARTIAYGVSKADTVAFTVTTPYVQSIHIKTPSAGFSIFGPTITIRPYGLVFWLNDLAQPIDIVFDDPAVVTQPPAFVCEAVQTAFIPSPNVCGTGNVSLPASANLAAAWTNARVRQFAAPGSYNYHDAQSGATGKIVVMDEPTP